MIAPVHSFWKSSKLAGWRKTGWSSARTKWKAYCGDSAVLGRIGNMTHTWNQSLPHYQDHFFLHIFLILFFLQVQISKKGVYAPGTRNRLVTIKGTQVQYIMGNIHRLCIDLTPYILQRGIESAAYLIQQKIQEEEEKRQRSGRTWKSLKSNSA